MMALRTTSRTKTGDFVPAAGTANTPLSAELPKKARYLHGRRLDMMASTAGALPSHFSSDGQNETTQINTLRYGVGEEAEDIHTALKLTDDRWHHTPLS